MKIEGPAFDQMMTDLADGFRKALPSLGRIMRGSADTLEALPEFLKAKTAESRIAGMHTDRDREYMQKQVSNKDKMIADYRSKLLKSEAKVRQLESGRVVVETAQPQAQEKKGKREVNPREALRNFNHEENQREPANRIAGLEKIKLADQPAADDLSEEPADFEDAEQASVS